MIRCVREAHPTRREDAGPQAAYGPAPRRLRGGWLKREGLIYTRHGVLDATRRRVQRQPAVEPIVGRIGGVRIW